MSGSSGAGQVGHHRELLDRANCDVVADELNSGAKLDVVGGGALRGIILHKLMEELLTGIVKLDQAALRIRSSRRRAREMSIVRDVPSPGERVRSLAGGVVRIRTGSGCPANSVQLATIPMRSRLRGGICTEYTPSSWLVGLLNGSRLRVT